MSRIYLVTDVHTSEAAQVRATSQAQAMRHICSTRLIVKVATQDELVDALEGGVTIETATNDKEQPA